MASVRTFTDLVRGQAAAVQGAAAGLVDFTVGSIARATTESVAQVVLWLQGLVLTLLATSRAGTSSGADLDSWVADFGLTRLPALAAAGAVTFGRFSTSQAATVPFGATVATGDGSQAFVVVQDPTNAAYTPLGYVLAAGTASITVPASAVGSGAAGNALAGTVTLITQAIPGVDTVTNALAFAGGSDGETDGALRARFPRYLGSLASATPSALIAAAEGVQAGAVATLVENQTYGGNTLYGYGYLVVDDGSGAPPTSFVNECAAAIAATRGFGVRVDVFPPTLVTANWSMTLGVAVGYTKAVVAAAVQASVNAYISALGLGGGLPISRLAQIAYDSSPGVLNVTNVQINSATADLAASAKQVIKPGLATVSTP